MSAVNESEAFVHDLCRRTFLSLWSIENPEGTRKGEELADALIVVGDDVIVVSVKECQIKNTGNDEVDVGRWYRKAVEGSIRQLKGAANALGRMNEVRRRDNPSVVLRVPDASQRRMHFVAVALGADERIAPAPERHDFGFVHVFDRDALAVLMRELDTVTDFVAYLQEKESFLGRAHVVLEGGERDLLAMYVREGRRFPADLTMLLLSEGLWQQVLGEPEFLRRKEADKISYAWDHLIEEFAGHLRGGTLLGNAPQDHSELGLRYMVREKRFHRRMLGDAFIGFLRKAGDGKALSRVVPSPSGVVYVFTICGRSWSPEDRGYELRGYCAVLLERHPDAKAVVGIMTERPDGDRRHSFAMVFYENPITDEIRGYAADAREAGILRRQVEYGGQVKEFPDPE